MVTEEQVREILRDVTDPELGVGVVDLGLVYDISVGADRVTILMTVTTPACPMRAYLGREVETLRARLPGVRTVQVDLVWEPPWTPSMMSVAAKARLGWWA